MLVGGPLVRALRSTIVRIALHGDLHAGRAGGIHVHVAGEVHAGGSVQFRLHGVRSAHQPLRYEEALLFITLGLSGDLVATGRR